MWWSLKCAESVQYRVYPSYIHAVIESMMQMPGYAQNELMSTTFRPEGITEIGIIRALSIVRSVRTELSETPCPVGSSASRPSTCPAAC